MIVLVDELKAAGTLLRTGQSTPKEVAGCLDALILKIKEGEEVKLPENICIVWSNSGDQS